MEERKIKKTAGMTLIEMMMAIAIFIIGIEGFTLLFSRTWKTNSYVLEMGQSSMQASQGVNRVADYLRRARQGDNGAYPVKSAAGNDLVVYCDYDKDEIVERVHFYRSGADIFMGATKPTETVPKTYPMGDVETVKIISNVVSGNDAPIFSYYNKNYPADTANNPLTGTILNSEVRLIKIYFEINTNPEKLANNIKIQTFVEMRNLNDYNQIK